MLFSQLNENLLKNLLGIVLLKVIFGALQKGEENALLPRLSKYVGLLVRRLGCLWQHPYFLTTGKKRE
jgi:hypothetical protein